MFCVCDMALTVYSAGTAKAMNLNADEVKKEWVAGLHPGVQVVPSGVWAVGRVALSLLIAIGVSLILIRVLPHLPYGRSLVLETGLDARAGYASAPESDLKWVGKRGTAATPLRPAGIAWLQGERVDVVSQGEYIEADAPIEVVRVDGNRIVVRQALGGPGKE